MEGVLYGLGFNVSYSYWANFLASKIFYSYSQIRQLDIFDDIQLRFNVCPQKKIGIFVLGSFWGGWMVHIKNWLKQTPIEISFFLPGEF